MDTYQEISCPECGAIVMIPPPYTSWTCENCVKTVGRQEEEVVIKYGTEVIHLHMGQRALCGTPISQEGKTGACKSGIMCPECERIRSESQYREALKPGSDSNNV